MEMLRQAGLNVEGTTINHHTKKQNPSGNPCLPFHPRLIRGLALG